MKLGHFYPKCLKLKNKGKLTCNTLFPKEAELNKITIININVAYSMIPLILKFQTRQNYKLEP